MIVFMLLSIMSILTTNVEGMSHYIKMLCKYLERKIQHIHKGNVQQGVTLVIGSFHVIAVINLRLTCVQYF